MKFTRGVWCLVFFALLFGCGESPPPPKEVVAANTVAVLDGSGLLERALVDDARGFAWVPLLSPRIKVGDEDAADAHLKAILISWQEQFPRRNFVLAEPMIENGEIYGYIIRYTVR